MTIIYWQQNLTAFSAKVRIESEADLEMLKNVMELGRKRGITEAREAIEAERKLLKILLIRTKEGLQVEMTAL